ncbi:MAG: hypothetical protein ACD_55C00125G0001, partial [uncultured bacterium]
CVVLAVGAMVGPALEAANTLEGEGIDLTVVNVRFVKPLDRELILSYVGRAGTLVTIEENVLQGGFGSAVLELLADEGVGGVAVHRFGYPDRYVEQGEQHELRSRYGLDAEGIAGRIRTLSAR